MRAEVHSSDAHSGDLAMTFLVKFADPFSKAAWIVKR